MTGSTNLIERFLALSRRRLVLLDGPGAGKTTLAVQLLLRLLDVRAPADQVPVLLTANSWDTTVFVVSSRWLAFMGKLPWRTIEFLDDAHRLGLLRTAGPVYQFRHAELQDHLTNAMVPAA